MAELEGDVALRALWRRRPLNVIRRQTQTATSSRCVVARALALAEVAAHWFQELLFWPGTALEQELLECKVLCYELALRL